MKREFINGVTPEGLAQYAYLSKPEVWEGKEIGYTITLRMNDKDTQDFLDKLNGILEKAKENGKKWRKEPFMGIHKDAEGHIVFKFKASSKVTTRGGETIKRTIPIVDAKCQPLDVKYLGDGTVVKVAYSLSPYWVSSAVNGIGLYLSAVQVIKYVPFVSGKGNSYGFKVEDGYDSSSEANEEAAEEFVDIDNAEF